MTIFCFSRSYGMFHHGRANDTVKPAGIGIFCEKEVLDDYFVVNDNTLAFFDSTHSIIKGYF